MHPVRRRKKRPNYGVRTVEVKRGQNGFGFTISGQHPCILSCIVTGSPAENAGLRAGDYLVAVEGQSVRKVPHDDVVRLIGGSNGILRLQIAENYYSDSSEDEVLATARQKPKYPHKSRLTGRQTVSPHSRAAKVVRDLRTGAMFEESLNYSQSQSPPRANSLGLLPDEWKVGGCHVPPPAARFHLPAALQLELELGNRPPLEAELFRVVVGYVGTIEMPRKLPPGSRLQIVRGCIKRLRAEKRIHTPVLMTVMTRSLRLTNGAGITLAVYPGERVTFCGSSSDKDHKHFGIVTTATGEDPSSSCHIFAVDARPHCNHMKRAKIFKLECQVDPSSGACKEFPTTCEPIIAVIKGFYESSNMNNMDEPVVANSPQPSNDSTTTTSNSDSGIGFRDDCGNQSDRILVVDVQNHRLHIQEVDKGGNWTDNKITVHSHPNGVAMSSRSRSPLSTGSEGPGFLEEMSVSSEATKSPDVTIVHKGHKTFTGHENCTESVDNVSIISSRSHDAMSISYKLSPKVFTLPPLASQSLEDLKDSHSEDGLPRNQQQSGSLQDLRTFSADTCFERCTASLVMHKDEDKGVSAWATSFEKLLDDQFGLHIFAEFLKKEFSHENIYFWVACEKYNKINEIGERKLQAKKIFERHLALGAPEPVNVDFYARQVTQEQLEEAAPSLFLLAQKQIFNLMKYDSYPRFIKSDLYKECVVRDLAGEDLPVHNSHPDLMLKPSPSHSKLKKSKSNADDRRRKSLLPWSRKARTKSHDRVSFDHDDSSVSSSRSSLANWDVPLSSGLCRVVLPDGSTAVVHSRNSQSVRHLISRLLDKRGLSYTDFLVVHSYLNKTIPLDEDAILLSGQEVRVERRVVFRLDLPNRKKIAVKSKPSKTLSQVLRPILHKYGYRLEMVTLCLMSENEVLEPDLAVTVVDNQRIQVLTRNTPTESLSQTGSWRADECSSKGKSLDEITNRVFEELLQVKSENRNDPTTASEPGSIRSEDLGSESSSGILGRFLRRDSALLDKNRKNKKGLKMEDNERKSTLSKLPPLIAKLKPSSKFESRSENDVLYEGLKRAQRSRLEDQRGTEINFELPDFLKDKENTPQGGKKLCQLKKDADGSTPLNFPIEPRVSSPMESCTKTYSTGDLTRTSVEDLLSIYTARPSPPPLPPKPKKIPCTPSFAQPNDPRPRPRTRRAVYLDQPSSSFV